MRLSLLLAGAALTLAACGSKNEAANTTNADENLAGESIVSNDVTAIDAVTGDASNMAADVNYTEPLSGEENAGGEKMPSARKPRAGNAADETTTPVEAATNNAA